jgi:gamma-glutamyltranspeptidase
MGYNTADYWHVIIETAKLAHADKDKYYGDPILSMFLKKAYF